MTSSHPQSHITEEEKRVKASILDDKVKSRRGLGGRFNISDSVLLNFAPGPSLHRVAEWEGVLHSHNEKMVLVALFCSVTAV